MSTFHNFASFQSYCLCPGGRGECTVGLGIPLRCPGSSTPRWLQSVVWGSTGARDWRIGKYRSQELTEGTEAPVPFAPHSRPGPPITSQKMLRNPLPTICSAPPPSEAFKQCSLQCFLLALSSSAKHQAPSHSLQQAFEGTSSSLHESLGLVECNARWPFSHLLLSSQTHRPKSASCTSLMLLLPLRELQHQLCQDFTT